MTDDHQRDKHLANKATLAVAFCFTGYETHVWDSSHIQRFTPPAQAEA